MLHVAPLDEPDDNEDETEANDTTEAQAKEAIPIVESPELNAEIVDAAQIIIDLQQDRKLIQAQIQEQYERLEAKGIVKAAFKTTIKDLAYDQEQRDRYDQSLRIARSACGIPVQMDLFQ